MNEPKAFTIRISGILYQRIMAEVRNRQQGVRRYAMGDWIEEACRAYLDGPTNIKPLGTQRPERTLVPDDDYAQHRLSAAEIAARIPGVRKGL